MTDRLTRRSFGKTAAAGALTASMLPSVFASTARAAAPDKKTLRFIAQSDLRRARAMLADVARDVGAQGYMATSDIAKVSVIGTGLRGSPEMYAKVFRTLADASINIQMIATSEIHITCIIDRALVRDAVRALHQAFELERI